MISTSDGRWVPPEGLSSIDFTPAHQLTPRSEVCIVPVMRGPLPEVSTSTWDPQSADALEKSAPRSLRMVSGALSPSTSFNPTACKAAMSMSATHYNVHRSKSEDQRGPYMQAHCNPSYTTIFLDHSADVVQKQMYDLGQAGSYKPQPLPDFSKARGAGCGFGRG